MTVTRETATETAEEAYLERAWAMVPALRERAAGAERMRRMPPESLAEAVAAGFFEMFAPRRIGGQGLELQAVLKVARILTHGCPSSAWTIMFLINHVWFVSKFPPEAQDEAFAGRTHVLVTAPMAIPGRAVRVDGGYRVSGRWAYASAVMHAEWAIVRAAIDGDETRRPYAVLVPLRELTVHDTWHVSGMSATGSHDISGDDVFVPDHRFIDFAAFASEDPPGAQVNDDPFVRYPIGGPVSGPTVATLAIGIAERALELFRERAERRTVAYNGGPQTLHAPSQVRYARASATVDAARALLDEGTRFVSETYVAGGRLTLEEQARVKINSAAATEMARDAVTTIVDGSGSSLYRLEDELGRYKRDIDVVAAHITADWDAVAAPMGSILMGNEPPPGSFF